MQASRRNSGGDVEGGYQAARKAESCTLLSYRLGAVFLTVLAVLLIGGVVFLICIVIDAIHISRPL